MRAAGLVCLIAAVVLIAVPVIDRAIRNHRKRQARMALVGASSWLDALIQEALEDGVNPDDDRIYQDMCFERWQQQIDGVA